MDPRTTIAMVLAAAPLWGGCLVENLCMREPERAECQTTPMEGPASLLSRRLPLSGGELLVKVDGVPASVELLLTPQGLGDKRVMLQPKGDGSWHASIKPQELWPTLAPGPVAVRVVTPTQTRDAVLRLFVPPMFGPDVSRSAGVVWLTVTNHHIITLEEGTPDRVFGDWTYQGTVLSKTGSVPGALAFTVPATAIFAGTESVFVRLVQNGSAWQLQQSLLGELRYADIEARLDYSTVTSLAVGKHGPGNLLAMAGEGGSGPALRVYRLPDGGGTAQQLSVTAPPSPQALLGTGLLDGDSNLDLVAIGKDGVPSVWRANAPTLDRDGVASKSLADQLGTEPVSALAVGDLDRDGLADVIVSRKTQLQWLANQGDGTFAPPALLVSLQKAASTVDVGPIDGNDSPDLVVAVQGIILTTFLNQAQ
jgi:hypothetical protein